MIFPIAVGWNAADFLSDWCHLRRSTGPLSRHCVRRRVHVSCPVGHVFSIAFSSLLNTSWFTWKKHSDSKYWKKYSDSKYTYNLHFHSSSPEQEQKQKMTIIGHQHMTSLSLQQQIQCKKAKRIPYASFLIEKWRNRAKDLKPIRSSTKTAQTMFTFHSI